MRIDCSLTMVFESMNIIPAKINHEILRFPENSVNVRGSDLQTFQALLLSLLSHPRTAVPDRSYRETPALRKHAERLNSLP